MNERKIPRRKHPAHGVRIDPHHPTIVYLTVCTKSRHPWLATPEVHALLRSIWMDATGWLVGKYVIMPDHVHLFAAPGEMKKHGSAGASPSQVRLENWVRYWKSRFVKHHCNPAHRWQTDYWDTRLRTWESYADKWEYVRNNPVRHGLVKRAEDWPFQGEIYDLSW